MTIKEMHYDFKKKLNKIDSQQYRNLLVPEIDWVLNEAQELFVKMIAKPRVKSHLGFEGEQRSIDDIRAVVIHDHCIDVVDNTVTLPADYWHFVKAEIIMTKGNCALVKGAFKLRQHDDNFQTSPFDTSSFEWRSVNGVFYENGIKLYDDGTFINNQFCLSYIRQLKYIHNAEDFRKGVYKLPSGIELTGTQDSELPSQTHREIVDIAVLITTNELNPAEYQLKQAKLQLNQLQ